MTQDYFVLDDLQTKNKTIVMRVDVNSPVDPDSGRILDTTRIQSHINTIEYLADSKVVLLGHQSRPGKKDYISLNAHAKSLNSLLKRPVKFVDDLFGQRALFAIKKMAPGDIILLENVRFFAEEIALSKSPIDIQSKCTMVKNLSPLADFFVNDAFAAAHRAQPSLVGFTPVLPSAAGLLMEKELTALDRVLNSDERPSCAILGGAKVNDSLEVADNMLNNGIVDKILTTGLVANIFLIANGHNLGKPNIRFLESEFPDLKTLVEHAKMLLKKYKSKLGLPIDIVGNNKGTRTFVSLEGLPTQYPIYDIGLETIVKYSDIIKKAKVVIANGPAGVFEIDEFSLGTDEIFDAIANSKGYCVVGGGETIAVIDKLGITDKIDHISTGGGACINYLAGRPLPAVEALKDSKNVFGKKNRNRNRKQR